MNEMNTRRALFAGGFALTVACGLAFAPNAHACEGKARGKKMQPEHVIQRFDKNKNGVLEVTELPKLLQERLAAADTNRDGKLSAEELTAHRAAFQGHHGKRFARLDKNGDGVLTKDEVGEGKWERIAKADADKDGKVTQAELQQARAQKMIEKRAKKQTAPQKARSAEAG